jgi:hypothetical protein
MSHHKGKHHGEGDPFDMSKAEAQSLIEQTRNAIRRLRAYAKPPAKGKMVSITIDEDAAELDAKKKARRTAQECQERLDSLREEVVLLRSVVDALKSGRVRKASVPHHILAEREDFVDEAEAEANSLTKQLDELRNSPSLAHIFAASPVPPVPGIGNSNQRRYDSDDDDLDANNEPLSMEQEKERQQDIEARQLQTLDRLHVGLTSVQNKAGLMQKGIEEDDKMLGALKDDIERVDTKLHKQMQKVNVLLEKMSARRKCGLVTCLVFTAMLLLLLIVTM